MRKLAILVCVAAVLAGCGLGGSRTGVLTLRVTDGMGARAIMPGVSLDADHYAVHGVGTSGQADGASFDLEIPAGQATADIELLPGDWTITATVWNDDTPSVAVGSAAAATEIVLGTPATVNLHVTPYTGPGTLVIDLDWVPDVIAYPGVEAELVTMGGVSTPVPMTVASSTAANGTLAIEQGWYTGAIRIYDDDVLNAGIVRAVRIASGATTTWTEFLTVNQLEGGLTLDMSWYPGEPLTLTTNPAPGVVILAEGTEATFTVTGVNNDPATSVIYAWYMNGELTALSTATSLTLDGDDFYRGGQYYLSCVAFQSDGKRAGDVQWAINRLDVEPEALEVRVEIPNVTGGNYYVLQLYNSTASIEIRRQEVYQDEGGPLSFALAAVPPGEYYLHLFRDNNHNGSFADPESHRWWQPVADSGGLALVPAFAANVIVPNDGTVIYTVPDLQQIQ